MIILPLLGEGIRNIFLLQEQVSRVGDVREDDFDVGIAPFEAALGGDAFSLCLP